MSTLYQKSAVQTNTTQDIMVMQGRAIGGSTLVNHALCFRLPEQIADKWSSEYGLAGKSTAELASYYEGVEKIITPKITTGRNLNENSRLFHRQFSKRGWQVGYGPRNVKTCGGCGNCTISCPTGAKNSSDRTFLPMAHQMGAKIYSDFEVKRLHFKDSRVDSLTGVILDNHRNRRASFKIQAKIFILAAGAVQTPLLLQRSDFTSRSGQVGKNFIGHPLVLPQAVYKEPIDSYRGVPQSVYSWHLAKFGNYKEGSILFLGDFEGFMQSSMQIPGFGKEFARQLLDFRKLGQAVIFLNETTTGEIITTKDDYEIIYTLSNTDKKNFLEGCRQIGKMFFEAGAERVMFGNRIFYSPQELVDTTPALFDSFKTNVVLAHPMGSCRMGSPETGVVDAFGKVHGINNLYLADSSIMPGSTGVNPQLTVMALAAQISEKIISHHRSGLK